MDSSGPAVGETTSLVVQRTEGSHFHSFVAGWFVLAIEVSIAMVSWFHLGQRIGFESQIFGSVIVFHRPFNMVHSAIISWNL